MGGGATNILFYRRAGGGVWVRIGRATVGGRDGWVALPGLDARLVGEAVVALYRDNVAFGAVTLDGVEYRWQEGPPPHTPPAGPPSPGEGPTGGGPGSVGQSPAGEATPGMVPGPSESITPSVRARGDGQAHSTGGQAMSHPAGRERLEQLARQKRLEREQRAAQREQERARAAEGRVLERARTAELYRWCLATFSGYRLPESGQELWVYRAAWADAVNVHAYLGDTRLAPGAEYVGLAVPHPGPGAGDEQRFLLLVLARFAGGHYEVIDEERALSVRSREAAQDCLLNFVADLGGERLGGLVDRVGRQGARFRPGGPT